MPTRRTLLGSVGAASLGAVAGCTGRVNQVMGGGSNGTTTTATTTTGNNSTTSETTTKPSPKGGRYHLGKTKVLEDFEDLSGWNAQHGSLKPNTDEKFAGSQSMRLTAPKGNQFVFAKKSVDWDLSDKTLSMALKIDSPVDNLIVYVRLIAPDTNNAQVMGEFVRSRKNQGWMRLDLATRTFKGNPDLSSVKEVEIGMRAAQGAIDFSVDDLRTVPRPDKGYVVLSFDDSLESHYTQAFKILKKYDMVGSVGTITGNIGQKGSLTLDQMKEMQKAGWEFASHSTNKASLTSMSTQQMWLAINDAGDWLDSHGFKKGGRSFVYPSGEFDDSVIKFVSRKHDMAYRYMDPLSAASGYITDPMTIGRGNAAYSTTDTKTMVNYAELFHNLTVFTFHGITQDKGLSVSPSTFEDIVRYIDNRDVEVITYSDIGEKFMAD